MTVKPPRMTQMSWSETREALEAHGRAITQLYGNCDALKTAINGEIVDGKLTSPCGSAGYKYDIEQDEMTSSYDRLLQAQIDKLEVAIQAMTTLSFWGRLKWLLTGRVA